MALIACPECGQTILDVASVCPHCDADLEHTTERFDYVTGERVGLSPRPAAQLARRPFRFPSRLGLQLMIGGGLLVILGSFLKWGSGPTAESGLAGVGPLTLALGIAIGLVGFSARVSPSYVPRYLVATAAVAAIVLAVLSQPDTGMGGGLRILYIGAVGAVVGSTQRER
jgi:hypothetical protein